MSRRIINLTASHPPEQATGVTFISVPEDAQMRIRRLLAFEPKDVNCRTLTQRANTLAQIAAESGADTAMIGGAPFFQYFLVDALIDEEIEYCYPIYGIVAGQEVLANGLACKVRRLEHVGYFFSDDR